jgi:2-hydroxychromene-2-carboxylate isomerase
MKSGCVLDATISVVPVRAEARRTGRYAMTEAERAAVNNGLQQVRRGEFASDVEMQSFWKRFGVA